MTNFIPTMKMADLVDSHFHLLSVVGRMGFTECFGERTVAEICEKHGVDPDTFLLLCKTYADAEYHPTEGELRSCRVADVVTYLQNSHDYYLNNALVSLAASMEKLLEPCEPQRRKALWKFFLDYKNELDKHFEYEEGQVIPYIKSLLSGSRNGAFSIDTFEDNHSNIDEKLSDLKNLIMKSLPSECDERLRMNLLLFIFHLSVDLDRHTVVEDELLVPMVRLIENPFSGYMAHSHSHGKDESDGGELSDREKEILVSVAQGLLNKEIADKHNISINTVITHRKNITRKIGIKTVSGLTVYAILNNLIDINSIE